jgi:hypothetical protein
MATATHQTIRLGRGAHGSPEQGACVMELASMLAGEKFTDSPKSVSPVITRFLRAYNDRLDDERRQALYGYAARVVGTRASRAVERTRAALCVELLCGLGHPVPWLTRVRPGPQAGAMVAKCLADDDSPTAHVWARALLDELIACGDGFAGTPNDPSVLSTDPTSKTDNASERR